MASETVEIIVRLRDQASKGFRALGLGLKGVRSGLKTATQAVFSLKGALAGVGAGLLAKSFVKAASSAEGYRTRLNVLLRSQSEGNRLFKEMSEFAGTVSFQYEEIMGSATNLAGVMEGGVDEIKQWMPGIANLAAASGLSIQDTTMQIVRMYSAGAASADLFRERGVLAMLGFQAGVSVSAEETRKRLMEVFEDPGSRIAGAATELAKGWEGMLSMMSDRWFQFRNLVMDAGVFDFMKAALSELLGFMDRLQKEGRLDEWAQSIASGVLDAFQLIAQAAAVVADAWRGWQIIWEGLKGGFALFSIAIMRGTATMAQAISDVFDVLEDKVQGIGETMVKLGDFMGSATLKGFGATLANADKIAEKTQEIADGARVAEEFWGGVFDKSTDTLGSLTGQETALTKVNNILAQVRARAEQYAAAAAKAREATTGGGGPGGEAEPVKPSAALDTIFKSQISRGREVLRTGMAQLEALYDQGEVTLQQYFDKRKQMMIKQFSEELAILEQRVSMETEVNKRMAMEDQIFALRQQHTRQMLDLDEEQRKSAEQLAADRLKLEQTVTQGTQHGLAALEGAMDAAYSASGDSMKEFFIVGKAASVAQATIDTYKAAQAAYAAMAVIPIVGPALGVAAAAAAVIAGLARVSQIRQQSFAEGGSVPGTSPHSKADNIGAWLTAKEFVEPVSAVKYYGQNIFEAMRRKAIPREIFAGMALPQPRQAPKFAFATGGVATAQNGPAPAPEIKIMNFVDQRELLAALGSPEGDDAIVNSISRNQDRVNRVLR